MELSGKDSNDGVEWSGVVLYYSGVKCSGRNR